MTLPGAPDPVQELITWTESAFRKKVINIMHRCFMHKDKTLTDLQILGCELNQNAFGGRAPPGPTV